MIKQSIKRRIVAIAAGLIVLMVATSILSMVMVGRTGHLLDELTARYIPANAHLTRINMLSLERALALRRTMAPSLVRRVPELGHVTVDRLPRVTIAWAPCPISARGRSVACLS